MTDPTRPARWPAIVAAVLLALVLGGWYLGLRAESPEQGVTAPPSGTP